MVLAEKDCASTSPLLLSVNVVEGVESWLAVAFETTACLCCIADVDCDRKRMASTVVRSEVHILKLEGCSSRDMP